MQCLSLLFFFGQIFFLPELKSVLASMGERMSDAEIEDMLFEADADGNGVIDFSGFSDFSDFS